MGGERRNEEIRGEAYAPLNILWVVTEVSGMVNFVFKKLMPSSQ